MRQLIRQQAVLVLVIAIIGAIIYLALVLLAIPAHGQIITTPMPRLTATATPALRPVAWFIAQKSYVAPVNSSCVAPGPCEQE